MSGSDKQKVNPRAFRVKSGFVIVSIAMALGLIKTVLRVYIGSYPHGAQNPDAYGLSLIAGIAAFGAFAAFIFGIARIALALGGL